MLYHSPSVVLCVFLFLINLELFSGKKKSCFVPLFFFFFFFFVCKCAIIPDFVLWEKKQNRENTTFPLLKLLNCHLPDSGN